MPRQPASQSPDAISLFSLRSKTPSTYVCPDSEEDSDNTIYAYDNDDDGDRRRHSTADVRDNHLGASLPLSNLAARRESTAATQARQPIRPQGGRLFTKGNCFSPPPEPEGGRPSPPPPGDAESESEGEGEGEEEQVSSYDAADVQEEGSQQDEWESRKYKVTACKGSHLTAKLLRKKVLDLSSATEAVRFIQTKRSVDYSMSSWPLDMDSENRGRSRGRVTRLLPTFFLDFLAVIGKPGQAVSRATESHPLSSISISFKDWSAPYSSKHIKSMLDFSLIGRTFKVGADGLAMTWFIIFTPDPRAAYGGQEGDDDDLEGSHGRTQGREMPGTGRRKKATALRRHRAQKFSRYFLACVGSTILGRGIEDSWRLNGQETAQLSLRDWARLQDALLSGWADFVRENSARDRFWAGVQLAFHAYGYGGNVCIDIGDDTPVPDMEEVYEDKEGGGNTEDEYSSLNADTEDEGSVTGASPRRGSPAESVLDEFGDSQSEEDGDDGVGGPRRSRGAPRAESAERGARLMEFAGRAPGIQQLSSTIEAVFCLDAVHSVAYALAADINCLSDGRPVCLLADFQAVEGEYLEGTKQACLTPYPLAFHPGFGNFTSTAPPDFIKDAIEPVRLNMRRENDDDEIVAAEYFQGYSNIKKTVRFNPQDLLASKAIATAALALPAKGPGVTHSAIGTQQRLLARLRGEGNPDAPRQAIPYAREASQLEKCIQESEFAFRMEQVITVSVSKILPENRSAAAVFRPMAQLISLFLTAQDRYAGVLRAFNPKVFPGVLTSYCRIFELITTSILTQFDNAGGRGLSIELGEAMAAVDRLGSFCFTGDRRVLPRATFEYLGTSNSLRHHAFPYINPKILGFAGRGRIEMCDWPGVRDRKVHLLQAATLQFYYGKQVAAGREAEAQVQLIAANTQAVADFIKVVFRRHFIPEMCQFFAARTRKLLQKRRRGEALTAGQERDVQTAYAELDAWEAADENPAEVFSLEKFRALVATINKATKKPAGQEQGAITIERLSYNTFAGRVAESLVASASAGLDTSTTDKTLCSKDMTWLAALSSLFREASAINPTENAANRWRLYIADALREHRVCWVLGHARGTVTATVAWELVLDREPVYRDAFSLLKRTGGRAAAEDERAAKRRKSSAFIDFGCTFPLREGLPPALKTGYDILVFNAKRGGKSGDSGLISEETPGGKPANTGLINHYNLGLSLLQQYQAEPEVELLCMLAMTVGMTEGMALYETKASRPGFIIDTKPARKKRKEARAFLLALRMLWFLKPDKFREKKPQGPNAKKQEEIMFSMQSVREATGKFP
ncbi:uncharacterized protein Triagg1_10872 [Trichoderma aggressivum f. europaeum]|uniref:Uncharacterized protein n=1 Tax=Trichoderma aggressivum f. europaeum TaxID=173218 RepID=A0AAE1I8A5_9HYPO|nr:hypothetical protein Triagg1_10872 [Trichoderma aggressivum f. europaeum]